MSVVVPSLTSLHSHQPFSNRQINGTKQHSGGTDRLPANSMDLKNDQVPFGVVNSMKKRFLEKVNESLLSNNNVTFTQHSLSKPSSNENLLSTSSLNRTTRLSRSQDSLLINAPTEQLTSYLQPKQDVIIIDAIVSPREIIPNHRHSYTELHLDEVPKPGTVTTVKNMFERQIRMSRYDSDKLSNTPVPLHSRGNNQHREILSPHRSRSISPNDMALRQRRTTTVPPSTTTLSVPVLTLYPDLVISHTPLCEPSTMSTYSEKKMHMTADESTSKNANFNPEHIPLSPTSSSDTQSLDFKSRLALFNRTNIIERSEDYSSKSYVLKKPSDPQQTVSPAAPKFFTKPVVYRHHTEKSDQIAARTVVNSSKTVTFFGGTKTNGHTDTISIFPSTSNDEQPAVSPSNDLLLAPDIIGGNIKLDRSSIFSGLKKDARVQFIDDVNIYEYPSFHVVMADFSSTDSDEDSLTNDNKNQLDEIDEDELEKLARTNAEINSNNLNEKPLQPKGTLHTFRPTHLHQYELGSQHGSFTNANPSDNQFASERATFDSANNVQWSSMSTTTDLLF